jgi:hypothetical protein
VKATIVKDGGVLGKIDEYASEPGRMQLMRAAAAVGECGDTRR